MRISDWSSDVCSSDLVEREGNRARLTPETGAEGFGAGEVAAADQQFETGKISQQFGKPSAEDAIAAENQGLHRHNMRSLYSGGAIQQFTRLPKNRYRLRAIQRSEEHTSELQSLMRSSYDVVCLKKKRIHKNKYRK